MTNRIKQIRLASWVGIITNSALAIFIIWSGVIAGSFSLVANGVDSSGDVLISVLTLFISYLLSRPPNVKFPYGYGKAEPNATVLLSFVIFFAGAQLVIASVTRLGEDNVPAMPDKLAIYAIVTSVVAKVCLALFQKYMGKKTQSSMLLAYARNMQGDVVISFSVFVGLILTNLLDLPVLDIIIALAVGIWVMWVAVKIFIDLSEGIRSG
jgi:cation diffusion facilitator family transporter